MNDYDYAYGCARDAVDEVLFHDHQLLDYYNELLDTNREETWGLVIDIQNHLTENIDPRNMVDYLKNEGAGMVNEARDALAREYAEEFGKEIAQKGRNMNGSICYCKDGFHSYGNPAMTLETNLGRLVVYSCGDPGVYDEFNIDLVAPDGRILQIACVGVTENDGFDEDPELHVYAWNGKDEDVSTETILDVSDNSYWYKEA